MKKTFLLLGIILFVAGSVSAQQIASVVESAIAQYRQQNSSAPSSLRITSNDRSWEDQLRIVLNSQSASYPNIKRNFLVYSRLSSLPTFAEVSANRDWMAWWEDQIMRQAGEPGGFEHVGGRAVDVSVRDLNVQQKTEFFRILQSRGVNVLMEYYDSSSRNAQFGVEVERANLFHCTL